MKVNVPYEFNRLESHVVVIVGDDAEDSNVPVRVASAITFTGVSVSEVDNTTTQELTLNLDEIPYEYRVELADALQDLVVKVRPKH